jgi:signal transduction histidine kinase
VPYELDLEAIRSDGTRIWLTSRGEAVADAGGHPIYLRGTTQDITDRKLSEDALFAMTGRLITAQEEERARIARELHDDLSQRMALLQIGLEQFKQGMPGLSSQTQQQLSNIAEMATEVSSDIHSLSHQLHPARLDTLGLVDSLKGFCREFSVQHKLQVQFLHTRIPGQIPNDVTLCLFRIAQEALRNVVKHSGATEAEVELSSNDDEVDLCISDSGQGFNVESLKGVVGLGLISMRERLRLVGGHLSIESNPSHGTRIRVRIPQVAITARVDVRDDPNEPAA